MHIYVKIVSIRDKVLATWHNVLGNRYTYLSNRNKPASASMTISTIFKPL